MNQWKTKKEALNCGRQIIIQVTIKIWNKNTRSVQLWKGKKSLQVPLKLCKTKARIVQLYNTKTRIIHMTLKLWNTKTRIVQETIQL